MWVGSEDQQVGGVACSVSGMEVIIMAEKDPEVGHSLHPTPDGMAVKSPQAVPTRPSNQMQS